MTGRSKAPAIAATNIWLTEATTGLPLLSGLLATTVSILLALTLPVSGMSPGLADPLNLNLTTVAFLGPLVGGAAAAQASRLSRSGLLAVSTTTSRGRPAMLGVAGTAVAGWHILAFGLGTGLISLRADLSGHADPSMALLPVLGTLVILLGAAVGTCAGCLARGPLVAVLVAIGLFGWIYVGAFLPGRWSRVSPIYPEIFYQHFLEPHAALIAAQIGILAASAALVMAIHPRRRLAWTLVAVPVLATSVIGWWQAGPAGTQLRTAPEQVSCRDSGGTSLCFWPETRSGAEDAHAALLEVRSIVEPYWNAPNAFAEPGLVDATSADAVYIFPPSTAASYRSSAVRAIVPPLGCTSNIAVDAQFDLVAWLDVRATGKPRHVRYIDEMATADDAVQRRWVHERLAEMERC